VTLARRAKRRDATEPAILAGLRAHGYKVLQLDLPDLLVRRPDGVLFLLEVDGIKLYRRRKQPQLDFFRDWGVPRVKNLEEALAWLR